MKKAYVLIWLFFLNNLLAIAQENCKDIIYTAYSNNIIFDCCIREVRNGNIVYYTKEGDTLQIAAVAITKDGLYMDLTKFPGSIDNQKP